MLRMYVSKDPGLNITLPDGMIYKMLVGGVMRERQMLVFPSQGGRLLKTDQPEIQEFIEGIKCTKEEFEKSKGKYFQLTVGYKPKQKEDGTLEQIPQYKYYEKFPCKAFQNCDIERVPTPEEIELESKKKKQAATLQSYRDFVNLPGSNFTTKELNKEQLVELGNDIGLEFAANAKVETMRQKVEQTIYGGE
jgi:hypothetical protein